jgi:hypothetical protein
VRREVREGRDSSFWENTEREMTRTTRTFWRELGRELKRVEPVDGGKVGKYPPNPTRPLSLRKNVDPGWFLSYPHGVGQFANCIF